MIVSELPLLLQHLGPFAYLLLPSPLMLFHLSPAFDSTIHLTSRYWPSILPHRKQVDTSFLPPQILFYPPGSSSSLFFAPVSDGLSVVFCILLISSPWNHWMVITLWIFKPENWILMRWNKSSKISTLKILLRITLFSQPSRYYSKRCCRIGTGLQTTSDFLLHPFTILKPILFQVSF